MSHSGKEMKLLPAIPRQENWDDKLETSACRCRQGEYTLVAVAAKTDLQQEERIEVKSRYEMTFANNIVRDMAYTLQDIKVESGSEAVTQNVSLKRAVSCFKLQATDSCPDYQYSGYHDKRKLRYGVQSFYRILQRKGYHHPKFSFDPKEYQNPYIKFTLYTLLTDNDVTDIHITTTGRQGRKSVKTNQL